MIPRSLWPLALLTAKALAHGGLNNYTVGDTWYRGYDPNTPPESQLSQPWLVQRPWDSIDPIFDHDSPHLACNHPGSAAAAYIPIDAGDEITAVYWYWLHPTGPMAVWLAECGESCENVEPAELEWFKIWHAALTDTGALGLASSTWYQKAFQNWDGQPATWPVAVPPLLKPGLYLIRHEIISLHVAYRPQWYPECAHLNVSGTGDAVPGEEFLYKFPGAYSEDDPMTFLDIYSEEWSDPENAAKYTPPLGPVWDGGNEITNKYCSRC